jgi:proliferating cell nuclear antigen
MVVVVVVVGYRPMTEFRLYDDPGADVAEITTNGDVIKPFLNAIERVDTDAKIQIHPNGVEAQLVDPCNVFMADLSLAPDAFETFNVHQETRIGLDIGELKSLVRRARKNSNDELTLSIQQRELTATVARGYENHNVVSQGTMDLFDPDSIRTEPDIPDLDWDVHLTLNAPPLVDALSYGVGVGDHVTFAVKGVNQHTNALYIGGETDTRRESAGIDNIDTDTTAEAMFSDGYVSKLLGAIGDTDPEEVVLLLADEYPLCVKMERDGVPMEVEYMIAPRVQSE